MGYGESFEDDELNDAAESARLLGGKFIPGKLDRAEYERSFPTIVEALEAAISPAAHDAIDELRRRGARPGL